MQQPPRRQPSSVAASITSSGTACRPASTITKARPMFCQIDESETANMAMPGSLSQSVAIRPTCGLNR